VDLSVATAGAQAKLVAGGADRAVVAVAEIARLEGADESVAADRFFAVRQTVLIFAVLRAEVALLVASVVEQGPVAAHCRRTVVGACVAVDPVPVVTLFRALD